MIADMFLKTILRRSKQNKVAIVDQNGEHTYKDIIDKSKVLSNHICKISKDISKPQRIGILCSNDVSYTICQWASWMSNSVCVPLASSHPLSSLLYILKDSECSLVVSDHHFKEKALEATQKLSVPYLEITNVLQTFFSDSYFEVKDTHKEEEEALIIYTSGTTGKPKGVIVSHGNLSAQKYLLEKAWEVSENDVFLHALPLHHVHGITNALLLPLWVGATVYMMPRFDAEKAWDVLLGDNSVNVLNAVPTIYFKLIESYKKKFVSQEEQKFVFDTLKKKMRVMISGSAALPQPVLEGWKKISSHILLERYGMSELGMVLTNPLQGKRIPGAVGLPFPSVEVRIVSEDKREILVEGDSDSIEINLQYQNEGTLSGDLHVKGPSLFKGYLNRPDATNESFTTDGWFLTGDVASYSKTENVFRILGRASVDIIKSGGYKMSALDIERHLLSHSLVTEAAVLGVPNDEWGQIVFALISTENNVEITLDTIQEYLKTKIPKYQIPKGIKLIETIPRNAMGKVNKKELLKDLLENNL